jgi:hypothetical protein
MEQDRSQIQLEGDAWRAGKCPVCGNVYSIDKPKRERYCEFEEAVHPDHPVRGPLPAESAQERPE